MRNGEISAPTRWEMARQLTGEVAPVIASAVAAAVGVAVTIFAELLLGITPDRWAIVWKILATGGAGAVGGAVVAYPVLFLWNVIRGRRVAAERALRRANELIPELGRQLEKAAMARPELNTRIRTREVRVGKMATDLVLGIDGFDASSVSVNTEILRRNRGSPVGTRHPLLLENAGSTTGAIPAGGQDFVVLAYHESIARSGEARVYSFFVFDPTAGQRIADVAASFRADSDESNEYFVEFRVTVSTIPQLRIGPWSQAYRLDSTGVQMIQEERELDQSTVQTLDHEKEGDSSNVKL